MITYRPRRIVQRPAPILFDAAVSTPTIVVGVSDDESCCRAVEFAARRASVAARLVLVSATSSHAGPAHLSREMRAGSNALKGDAYLMEDAAIVDEVARRAREMARRAGAHRVATKVVEGAAHSVLLRVARDVGASSVVLGCSGEPGRTARRLAGVPDLVTIVVAPEGAFHLDVEPVRIVGLPWRRPAIAAAP